MKLLTLAWRNLLRNRRSLTTAAAIAIGAVTILIFGGYTNALMVGMQTSVVSTSGHLRIERAGYASYGTGDPTAYSIANTREVIDTMQHDPELMRRTQVITPVMVFFGLAGNFEAGVSRSVLTAGVVPSEHNRMRQWNDYGLTGYAPRTLALPEDRTETAVLGQGLARVLHLCAPLAVPDCTAPEPIKTAAKTQAPADISALADEEAKRQSATRQAGVPRIEILAPTERGVPNVASLIAVKAQAQGTKELDDVFLITHLSLVRRLLFGKDGDDRATAIVIQLKHTSDLADVKSRLRELFTAKNWPLTLRDFAEVVPSYNPIAKLFRSIFTFIGILMAVIVLFTVANTMSMAVAERTVEIGTLRSLGIRRSGIRRLFVLEGLLLGGIGAAVGIGLALALAYVINHAGLTWTPPYQVEAEPLNVRLGDDWALIAGTAVVLIAFAGISALRPSARAAKLPIVDALGHV